MTLATMGIRESLKQKPWIGFVITGVFVLISAAIVTATYWPVKKANLAQSYYSDDDGQTWFADSAFLVPPFEHNGKTAVAALIYSYDDGKKQFCAYLAEYTPDAKKKMESAQSAAERAGQSPGSIALYRDPQFMKQGLRVKKPGAGKPWIPYGDPKANEIFTITSPDGTAVDQSFVY
jgi:hypothetical protein